MSLSWQMIGNWNPGPIRSLYYFAMYLSEQVFFGWDSIPTFPVALDVTRSCKPMLTGALHGHAWC